VSLPSYRIPFNQPTHVGRELEYIGAALSNHRLSGDGPFTARCHDRLAEALAGRTVLLTTSCTHALEMAALLLDVGPGDEVIVPSFTFVSSVNAFVLRGAVPVFVDIRPDTLNIDARLVAAALTDRTRAIVVVHYAGIGCDMDAIGRIADPAGVAVVEDNAHGLYGRYRNRPLGTLGRLATLSFHETKNVTCGEGGALVLGDPTLLRRAEIVREKGTDRSRFFRGDVDKYGWVDVGSSYLPSEILAAYLLAQLEEAEWVQARRRQIWERYRDGLRGWSAQVGARLPEIPEHCDSAYHMFQVIMPSPGARSALIDVLKREGILAVSHYVPLHLSSMAQKVGRVPAPCPVTEQVSSTLVRLPFFTNMTDAQQDDVIAAICAAIIV